VADMGETMEQEAPHFKEAIEMGGWEFSGWDWDGTKAMSFC